jgi:hypothetical protein
MPPKTGGGGAGAKKRNHSQPRQQLTTNNIGNAVQNPLTEKPSQPKFNIAPIILEGVKVNKLQLNDILKQHLNDVKVNDIKLSRSGSFTLYANDASSFNHLLNDFTPILSANGHPGAKLFVPRSIQRTAKQNNKYVLDVVIIIALMHVLLLVMQENAATVKVII